jgi:hypothetical protein
VCGFEGWWRVWAGRLHRGRSRWRWQGRGDVSDFLSTQVFQKLLQAVFHNCCVLQQVYLHFGMGIFSPHNNHLISPVLDSSVCIDCAAIH